MKRCRTARFVDGVCELFRRNNVLHSVSEVAIRFSKFDSMLDEVEDENLPRLARDVASLCIFYKDDDLRISDESMSLIIYTWFKMKVDLASDGDLLDILNDTNKWIDVSRYHSHLELRKMLRDMKDNSNVLVLKVDGNFAGFVFLVPEPERAESPHIFGLYLRERYCRSLYKTELITYAVNEIKAKGVEQVRWLTNEKTIPEEIGFTFNGQARVNDFMHSAEQLKIYTIDRRI